MKLFDNKIFGKPLKHPKFTFGFLAFMAIVSIVFSVATRFGTPSEMKPKNIEKAMLEGFDYWADSILQYHFEWRALSKYKLIDNVSEFNDSNYVFLIGRQAKLKNLKDFYMLEPGTQKMILKAQSESLNKLEIQTDTASTIQNKIRETKLEVYSWMKRLADKKDESAYMELLAMIKHEQEIIDEIGTVPGFYIDFLVLDKDGGVYTISMVSPIEKPELVTFVKIAKKED